MSFGNTKTPTKKDLRESKQRYVVPQRRSKAGVMEFYIPEEMQEQFKKHVCNEMNRTVMEWYGISFSTLQRLKREFGLQKDMQKIRHKQAQLTKRICEKNGYYDSLRGKQPSEQCLEATRKLRASGFHPMKILKETNPRKYKRLMKKRSEERKELIAKERKRYEISLMPLTSLKTNFYAGCRFTRAETCRRCNAKKYGYVLGSSDPDLGERYFIYYDDNTNRSEIFEKNCIKAGFEVRNISLRNKLITV